MKIILKFGSLLICILLLLGCGILGSDDDRDVHLRVKNESNIVFSSVQISFDKTKSYRTVKTGEVSEYRMFELIYSYGHIEVEAGDTTYSILPIDYMGAKAFKSGHYTYVLDIVKGNLELEFKNN